MDLPRWQQACDPDCDVVMAAIVGAAGLAPTLAAARAGKKILLANKEALVMAGQLFMDAVQVNGATLLPIDSEHNAIFQCLPKNYSRSPSEQGVAKVLLTASGGPFLNRPVETLEAVTPAEAVAHPNWVMGRKISVDSATMMNKGLEVIEAHWLFGASADQIEVVNSSAKRDSFDGFIHRWLCSRAARQSGHAHSNCACSCLSRAYCVRRGASRSD